MSNYRTIPIAFLLIISGCNKSIFETSYNDGSTGFGKGALLTTKFNSFEELKEVIQIDYSRQGRNQVTLRHNGGRAGVVSILKSGINKTDFILAKKGTLWNKLSLGLQTPYAVINKTKLLEAYILARRRFDVFGEGDIAFFDFAQKMVSHINSSDLQKIRREDLTEKGYLNTFNHITAQAFMTTLFSEKMADFIADVHERDRLPELITGDFTEEQLSDLDNGAVDNYVDIINNEWGQELGKFLKKKFRIESDTYWTAELLANYLNEIQSYFSWNFQIGFEPFRPSDDIVIRFAYKLESIKADVSVY